MGSRGNATLVALIAVAIFGLIMAGVTAMQQMQANSMAQGVTKKIANNLDAAAISLVYELLGRQVIVGWSTLTAGVAGPPYGFAIATPPPPYPSSLPAWWTFHEGQASTDATSQAYMLVYVCNLQTLGIGGLIPSYSATPTPPSCAGFSASSAPTVNVLQARVAFVAAEGNQTGAGNYVNLAASISVPVVSFLKKPAPYALAGLDLPWFDDPNVLLDLAKEPPLVKRVRIEPFRVRSPIRK